MSNQIVISSGAKVRNLDGVLTGSTGVVGSVPLGAANGVATLDSGGKVPVSQLPSSVVTYLGTWDAATNTPTLTNGTGDAGDMYICNVAGTVNFGAGPITFAVGDWVLYGSGTWQKSNGQNGTVTSVAVTESGDALTITGSPITTAGTINIGFAGTSGQYVNGAGGLTTFPSLTGFVPYTGATQAVDLGAYDLTVQGLTIGKGASSLSNNSALGYRALFHITTGNYNTAVGYEAAHNTSTGQYNTALGQSSLFTNTTGSQNTALGLNALLYNTSGGSNVVVGLDAMQHNTTGSSNTALGYNAGSHITGGSTPNTTASNSVFIGRDSKAKVDGGTNEIVIGQNAIGNGSNTATIGNSSITANYFTGSINGGSFVKSGGTSSQFLKADGSVDSTTYVPTSRTLTINGVGYDLSADRSWTITAGISSVSGTSPISVSTVSGAATVSIATANTTTTGALTSTDWNTFNSKAPSVAGGYLPLSGGDMTGTLLFAPNKFYELASEYAADLRNSDIIGANAFYFNDTADAAGEGINFPYGSNWSTIKADNGNLVFAPNRVANTLGTFYTVWHTGNLSNPIGGSGTTNYIPKFTASGTIGNSAITDDGTTVTLISRALSGTSAKFSGANNAIIDLYNTALADANARNWRIVTNESIWGALEFRVSTANNNAPSSAKLILSKDGNTLIGTTTDAGYKLDVNGTGRLTGLLVSNSTDTYPEFRTSPSDADVFLGFTNTGDGNNAWGVGRRNTGEFWITNFTGNFNSGTRTTVLSLASTGAATFSSSVTANVLNTYGSGGLNSTAYQLNASISSNASASSVAPVARFSNNGGGYVTKIMFSDNNRGDAYITHYAGSAFDATTRYLGFGVDAVNQMIINANGNVGIGTNSPSYALSVRKDTNDWIGQFKNNGSSAYGVQIDLSGSTGAATNSAFQVYTQTGTGLRLVNNGILMLGTTSGVSGGGALQVNGNVNINGVFQINGVTIGGGGGSGVTGSGTTNNITKWTGSSTLGNSILSESGTDVRQTAVNGILTQDGQTGWSLFRSYSASSAVEFQIRNGITANLVRIGSYTNHDITLMTNAVDVVRISNTGNVGIKTASPRYSLDVQATSGRAQIGLFSQADEPTDFWMGTNNADRWSMTARGSADNYNLSFYSAGGAGHAFRIVYTNGNVLIGTTNDNGYKINLNGSISFAYGYTSVFRGSSGANDILVGNTGSTFYVGGSVSATGGFFDTSDSRLKTLITNNHKAKGIENVSAKLYLKNGKEELGYYAQDLQEILPSAVVEGADGFLTLSYSQVHTAKISQLEAEVAELKELIKKLL